jgi:hypothetical protein
MQNKIVTQCQLCGEKYGLPNLGRHLNAKHKDLSLKDYYLKFIDTSHDGICKFCGVNQATFLGLTRGFRSNCPDPVCHKKSISPFSKEYKMKVDGLSEEEFEEWLVQKKDSSSKKTFESFARARQEDPDFDKKNSRYCKEFWMRKGHSEEESIQLAYDETAKNRNKLKNIKKEDPDYQKGKSWVSYKYWMKKGMSEDEAKKHVGKLQATFSLEKCIEKYGEEEGRNVWKKRQEKWMKSNKKTNYSKASQDLFWKIVERQPSLLSSSKFATNNQGQKDESGSNHEATLQLSDMIIKPDFLIEDSKKIIEFDGHYWHSDEARKSHGPDRISNPEREMKKEQGIIQAGYSMLRVGEMEFRQSPETIIEKCLQFLNG